MVAQHEQAARFFDGVSDTYKEKYANVSPFHHYYFNERLRKAVHGMDLEDRDVLDIGSGTGDLYDHLITRFPRMRFHATDVSAGMLSKSHVPEDRRFVGHAYEHDLPVRHFDAIFMLGVTTYLSPEELGKNLAFMARSLRPGGTAVITFSNRHALDTWMRSLAEPFLRWSGRKDKVLSSGLRRYTYSYRQVSRLFSAPWLSPRYEVHNHTVFPWGLLLPRLSIACAERLSSVPGAPGWLRFLSSDLMVHVSVGTEGKATAERTTV